MTADDEPALKILLVEDSPTQAILAMEELSKIEYAGVEHVETLADALDALAGGGIHLVLLDLTLPDSDGDETVRTVCSNAPAVPVVVLTSRDDQGIVYSALSAGAQDFLVKGSVDADLFGRTFRHAIYRMQINEELRRTRDDAVKANRALADRIKKLECLYTLSEVLQKPDTDLVEEMELAAELIKSGWQFPDLTHARITFPEGVAESGGFRETGARLDAPIVCEGRSVGTVEVFCVDAAAGMGGDPFLDEERRLISEIARRLGEVIERTSYQRELRRLATTDPLTGANNRRSFMERAGREVARAKRYRRAISVLMMDIDHFKGVNDTHGHATGDVVLKRVVAGAREALRDHDVLGRMGGEEFAVLLPEDAQPGAVTVAERLREMVEDLEIPLDDGGILRVTTSVGLSECRPDDDTIETALQRADEALYRAKNGGRNRVEVA